MAWEDRDNHSGIDPTIAVDDCNVDSRFRGNDRWGREWWNEGRVLGFCGRAQGPAPTIAVG